MIGLQRARASDSDDGEHNTTANDVHERVDFEWAAEFYAQPQPLSS